LVAYQTAYLKANYPAAYMASVLTHNRDDQKKLKFYLEECMRMKLWVLQPDVNESDVFFTVNQDGHIRYALSGIKGVGASAVEEIIKERKINGPFTGIFNLTSRVNQRVVNKRSLEAMAYAGAFDCFQGLERADYFHSQPGQSVNLLEQAIRFGQQVQANTQSAMPSLFGESMQDNIVEPATVSQHQWGHMEQLNLEKEYLGVFISGHPLKPYMLDIKSFCNASTLNMDQFGQNQNVHLAGIVVAAEHRTDNREQKYGRFTLEDFEGSKELMLFGEDYLKYAHLLRIGEMIFISGQWQLRYRSAPQPDFKIQHMSLLETVRKLKAERLILRLDYEFVDHVLVKDLLAIVKNHPGETDVEIQLKDAEFNSQVTFTSKNLKFDLSDQSLIQWLTEHERFDVFIKSRNF
jgi:DNA polymerase-3 subunit alpha